MAKVQVIQKSRKENRCSKCGATIPVGSKYFKGEINFGPTIVRCERCKLQPWEVTTSDYILSVGEIVYNWRDNYPVCEDDVAEQIADAFEDVMNDQEERYENMPENLQNSPNGELLQERINALDSVINDLQSIDTDEIKGDALREFQSEHEDDEVCTAHILEDEDGEDYIAEDDEDLSYDEKLDQLRTIGEDNLAEELESKYEELLAEAIDEALSSLEV